MLFSRKRNRPSLPRPLRCYGYVVWIVLQDALEYRFNFIFGLLAAFLPLGVILILWQAIYGADGVQQIGGYTHHKMIAYFLIMFAVQQITSTGALPWRLSAEIRRGHLSRYLLKPMDHLFYELFRLVGTNIVIVGQLLLPLAVLALIRPDWLGAPAVTAIVPCLLAVSMAFVLNYLRIYIESLLAFWMEDTSIFYFLEDNIVSLLAGAWVPLALFPQPVYQVLRLLPFPYLLSFPVRIYLGDLSLPAIRQGMLIQLTWLVILYGLTRWVWKRGLRLYCAAGA